jgi:hypothetical protein
MPRDVMNQAWMQRSAGQLIAYRATPAIRVREIGDGDLGEVATLLGLEFTQTRARAPDASWLGNRGPLRLVRRKRRELSLPPTTLGA